MSKKKVVVHSYDGDWDCSYCKLHNIYDEKICRWCRRKRIVKNGILSNSVSSNAVSYTFLTPIFSSSTIRSNGSVNHDTSEGQDHRYFDKFYDQSTQIDCQDSNERNAVKNEVKKILPSLQPIPCDNINNYRFLSTLTEPSELERIYYNIIQNCKSNERSFIDGSFPHSDESIGDLKKLEGNQRKIIWLRPKDIKTKDGEDIPWTVFNDPQPTDIEQGSLGNCWLISSLALIAEHPEILEQILITDSYNERGIYKIRLCVNGDWETIFIDDYLPCYEDNHSLVFAIGRRNQLWVSLIEKALAKVHGSYAALIAGTLGEGLSYLTGARYEYISLNVDDRFTEDETIDVLQTIWVKLLSSIKAGFLIGCASRCQTEEIPEEEYKTLGLETNHAYSILDVKQYGDHALLKIRNPWGNHVWKGDWSPSWPEWQENEQYRTDLDYNNTGEHNGTFWILFRDFVKYFSPVTIAHFNEKYKDNSARYQLNLSWKNPKVLGLTVTENTEISFSLFQTKARSTKHREDLLILVHKEGSVEGEPGELVVKSEGRNNLSTTIKEMFLEPGNYVVLCLNLNEFFKEEKIETTLVLHCQKPVNGKLLDSFTEFVRESLIQMALKEGKIEQKGHTVIYKVIEDFNGWMWVIENRSNKFAQVKLNCSEFENLISSRGEFFLNDVIPPHHRKICLLLLPIEKYHRYGSNWKYRTSKIRNLEKIGINSPELYSDPMLLTPSQIALHTSVPI